jgi:hypothetical protein
VFWRWFWRVLALVATGALAWGSYTLATMASATHLKPTAAGQELINGFDVIAIQLNILTVVLTALGIGLGIAALIGYQGVKEAAASMAKTIAGAKADEVATKVVAEHIEKLENSGLGLAAANPQPVDPGQAVEMMRGDESDGGATGGGGSDQAPPRKRARSDRGHRARARDQGLQEQ